MSDEIPIGPNSCPACGGEYGEHQFDCRLNLERSVTRTTGEQIPTPRTDLIAIPVHALRGIWKDGQLVPVEFARQLERDVYNAKLHLDCERAKLMLRDQELARCRDNFNALVHEVEHLRRGECERDDPDEEIKPWIGADQP